MTPSDSFWREPVGAAAVAQSLIAFLRSLGEGHPRAPHPLLVERDTLHALYRSPHPQLLTLFRCCLDKFLVQLSPDASRWGVLEVTPHIWGMALAIYNCLTPAPAEDDDTNDAAAELAASLTVTVPPARTLAEAFAYHVLLDDAAEAVPYLAPVRANVLCNLLHRSPLSAACHLQVATPRPLMGLADQLLPGTKQRSLPTTPWRDRADWLSAALTLLERPAVARFVYRRWLAMSETRHACRNLGLLLEALRLHGGRRDFVLRFYEAYDYFRAEPSSVAGVQGSRCWPVLGRIERLLSADGDSDAAVRLNRRGHEYFLKFYPLIQFVITEGGVPSDYRLLTREFIVNLKPVWRLTAYRGAGGASRNPMASRFIADRA